MFKKTLLALSITAMAGVANAGTIATSVAEATPASLFGAGVGTGYGTDTALLGADDDCLLAASALGVTAVLGVNTNANPGVAGTTDGDDAITLTAATPNANNASSVIFGGNDACTVVIGDTASVVTLKSPIESPAGTVTFTASILSGVGGFAAEDTITINLTGAKIDTTLTTNPTLTQRGTTALAILDITATTVRFTVPSGQTVTNVEILDLAGIFLDSSDLSSDTDVKLDYFATNTSGTKYDITDAVSVHGLVPQYSAVVDFAFNGVIDVSAERQSLVASAATDTIVDLIDTDTLHVDVDYDATTNQIVPDEITFEIKGDFAWLNESANTSDDGVAATAAEVATYLGNYFKVDAAALAAPDSSTLNEGLTSLFVVDTTGGTVGSDYKFTFPVQGEATDSVILEETPYTVSVSVDDGVAAPSTNVMTAATDLSAGEWILNGSVITIPYMPFDANTAVILRHTNTGVQTGDLSVRYMLEGVSTSWETVGVVGSSSRGVANIRDMVMNAITADAGVTAGKVAIEIVTNVPTADVTVYAAYKVRDEKDRGFVGTFGDHGSAQ
ncbi:MAG: hypothetical protein QNK36_16595 [Colwellia sp.]|nr:hypothetical protein [Colwellia sp.]